MHGQPSCTPSDIPTSIYYTNTTSSYTPVLAPNPGYSIGYLCGPNAVVYDTSIINSSCRIMYVNSGCTLTIRAPGCVFYHAIYLKNNATLNILANSAGLNVLYEPLAIINNLSTSFMNFGPCPSLTFPTVNCAAGINEYNNQRNFFRIYPNPSLDNINIEFLQSSYQAAEIRITNQLGEAVYENKQWLLIDKEIPIDNLSNGSYFIHVNTKLEQQTEKLIIIR